ncbi:MAG: heparan N-sulfatase, partial [Pirellulales bacterium]
ASLRRRDRVYGQRTVEAYVHRPRLEVYDLAKDPDELHNVADDPMYATRIADMREKLKSWQKATQDPWMIKYEHE